MARPGRINAFHQLLVMLFRDKDRRPGPTGAINKMGQHASV